MLLKIQRDWLETVSSGSLFHSVIVLGKKENLKISLCPFGTVNLKSWLKNHHQDIIVMNPLANRKRLAQYEQSIPAFIFNLSSKIIQYNYTTLIIIPL